MTLCGSVKAFTTDSIPSSVLSNLNILLKYALAPAALSPISLPIVPFSASVSGTMLSNCFEKNPFTLLHLPPTKSVILFQPS